MIDSQAMKQISIRITVPSWERMRDYCKKHRMTQSEFIRLAIEKLLESK